MQKTLKLLLFMTLITAPVLSWAFSAEDFVGTWQGQFTSTTFGGSQFNMTLNVQSNGFYTDSSGHLMPPSYYPNTQQWEFDAATNRLHFWYLDLVYAGQYFYQHFYYE